MQHVRWGSPRAPHTYGGSEQRKDMRTAVFDYRALLDRFPRHMYTEYYRITIISPKGGVYMKKCVMTMLVTAMLLALAVCSAEGWPSADEVRASMWLQNSRDYLSDAGDTVDPAALGKDEYLAPRLFVTNSTGTAQTVSQSWTIDGRAIVFDDKTLKPGRTASWTIDSDAAAAFYTPGSHTLSAVINGQPGYSYTWTVKAAWPAASDISLQLWLQNADKYLSELGTDVNTASFGTDEYAAPRLQLFNNTAA